MKVIGTIENVGSSTEFKVVSVDPADGATNVSQNKQVSFTFNKPLLTFGASIQQLVVIIYLNSHTNKTLVVLPVEVLEIIVLMEVVSIK